MKAKSTPVKRSSKGFRVTLSLSVAHIATKGRKTRKESQARGPMTVRGIEPGRVKAQAHRNEEGQQGDGDADEPVENSV